MRKDSILRQLEQEWTAAVASLPREELTRPGWLRAMPAPGPWRPAALFAELEDVRHEWQELREWPALRKHADSMVNPGWTYKDLLAHLASWAVEMLREVEGAAGGEVFDYEIPFDPQVGPTEWNEREVARRRAMTLDDIFEQFDAATARLQDLVIEIAPQKLLGETRFPIRMGANPLVDSIAHWAVMKCSHDRRHFTQIRTRLAALEKQV